LGNEEAVRGILTLFCRSSTDDTGESDDNKETSFKDHFFAGVRKLSEVR
jgi:hypothetical protein